MAQSGIVWLPDRAAVPAVAFAAAVAVLTGCGAPTVAPESASAGPPSDAAPAGGASSLVGDYRPGLPAEMRLPAEAGPAPLVVMVPGGGWQTADPAGLVPLAESLTGAGAVTTTITYRTTADGATFPAPVDDVACAVRWAAARAGEAGYPPSDVILLGHSAGGHLAALVTLSGDRFGGTCPEAAAPVTGLVGLAGVYSVEQLTGTLDGFFGTTRADDVDRWNDGDPLWWAEHARAADGLRVLLLHGDADEVVPVSQTALLADALTAAGIEVTVEILPGQTHGSVYEAGAAADPIAGWLAGGT